MSIGCFGWTVSDGFHCGEGLPIPRGLASVGGVGVPRSKSGLADLRCS